MQGTAKTPEMTHEYFMREALTEAQSAANREEVPIGCVIVFNNQIIARSSNMLEESQDPTSHAEILAIKQASEVIGSRRLLDCTLYVTLEPCPMCAGAIVNARIPTVVYAASDPKAGACDTLYSITNDSRLNHRCTVHSGILAEESANLLRTFFKSLRNKTD